MSLLFYGPAVAVFVAGLVLFARVRKRLRVETKVLFPGFFGHVIGWGFLAILALVIFVVVLTIVTGSGQAPLWLLFGPWAFAAGEGIGLVRWLGRHGSNRAAP